MNTTTMTRAQFMAELQRLRDNGLTGAFYVADLERRAGIEWLPEQVDPVVGELLTERTRLIDGMGVVTGAGAIWQYIAIDDYWYVAGVSVGRRTAHAIRHGARIIYAPGIEVTHE